jgi:hypothetical protein
MSQLGLSEEEKVDPIEEGISSRIQAVGIYTASRYWHEKIAEQPGGASRRRFIDLLGRKFYGMLLGDLAMSYPGRNGFSIANDELQRYSNVERFLGDAVDYGDLQEALHTTKSQDGRMRTKWYLNPILSPFFKLPESHVKEPFYTNVRQLLEWLTEADVELGDLRVIRPQDAKHRHSHASNPGQLDLYAKEN